MSDWLGTGKLAPGSMRPFKEARAFVRELNFKNIEEWNLYCKNKLEGFEEKPRDIPAGPHNTYKDEWKGFGNWLGTGKVANKDMVFRPFEEARAFVQKLGLKTHRQWQSYSANKLKEFKKKPADIPSYPNHIYKDEWKGWPDFLGKKK